VSDHGRAYAVGNFTVSGNCETVLFARCNSLISIDDTTITITGSLVFGNAFAHADQGAICRLYDSAWSGSVFTTYNWRYTNGGIIDTDGDMPSANDSDSTQTTGDGWEF
jgi:hypothetical protein